MNILVIDDVRAVRKVIELLLKEAGYNNLFFAESAFEALERLGIDLQSNTAIKSQCEMDLILSDIILPDMDGRSLCRKIKSFEHLKDIPVIMVTSLLDTDDLEKAFTSGAMDYITKPINRVELLARVRSALKLKSEMDRRRARLTKFSRPKKPAVPLTL